MIQEYLWNGFVLRQPEGWFRLGTDSVACAWFSRFGRCDRIADLGCGSGALALMLLASNPALQITGIELDAVAAAAARENAADNPAAFRVIEGDLRQIEALLPPGSMDGVIANPPYFSVGSGQTATGPRAAARSEETCSLPQLIHAAAWLLRCGGRFCLVHRPERLADLIWHLRSAGLEPKRICFARHHPDASVNLVLLEARKGGKPGLCYEPDLIFYDSDGAETPAYRSMYHRGE